MKIPALTAIAFLTMLFAQNAFAQNSGQNNGQGQLSLQDKQMMFLTCINRKPIKTINVPAAQECAKLCKPNGHPSTAQQCLDAYKAATGQDYVSNLNSAPSQPSNPVPKSIRGTGNYPAQ